MRKILIAALAAILVMGATPLAAQIAGDWAGTGTGYCYPRSSVIIYPWQNWEGTIPTDEDVFNGEWYDADGNQGSFESEILWLSTTDAVANGSWYWFDPLSADPVYGGDFTMKFSVDSRACSGTWKTIWPTPYKVGTMTGQRV